MAGTPIGWVWRPVLPAEIGKDELEVLGACLTTALNLGHEPTAAQDVTFALKQLTDVACKALSPGINDPRTAMHALGHSASLLCTLTGRVLGPVVHRSEDGTAQLYWDRPGLAELLDLALSGPRRYGAADPDVLARLYALLAELAWSSDDPAHRAAVRGQLDRLQSTAGSQDFDEVERGRLAELGEQVRAALQGRHRSPARAVVS